MRPTLLPIVGAFLLFAGSSSCLAQATVAFQNDSATRITNCYTRVPQSNAVYTGLYFTPDLSAVTNQSALDSMLMAGTPKLMPAVAHPSFHGRITGGIVSLPGVAANTQVVLRVKMWPTNFATYEQAWANGAEVAQSLPWVQTTGGGPTPPSIISRWGFRPFLYPQCEPVQVPLAIERVNANLIRVNWPVGVPPNIQVSDGTGTNWQALTSGTFVQDHWEFQITPANGVQLFRLAR